MPTARAIVFALLCRDRAGCARGWPTTCARPDKVSFYFAAHEDDWQLFMNPSAFKDVIKDAAKTVFVHVTAGDAGAGTGTNGRRFPYYRARENGAEAAIRFMADADSIPGERTESYAEFNGHRIYRIAYRNTVSYFLRVPDGNPFGGGYPRNRLPVAAASVEWRQQRAGGDRRLDRLSRLGRSGRDGACDPGL